MKSKKWILVFVLLFVLLIGWVLAAKAISNIEEKNQQQELLDKAEVFMEKGLYVRAVPLFEKALQYNTGAEKKELIQERLLDAYEGRGDIDAFQDLVAERISNKTAREQEYLKSSEYYFKALEGSDAIEVLKKGIENLNSEEIEKEYEENRYAYTMIHTNYQDIEPFISKTTIAYDGDLWYLIDQSGKDVMRSGYTDIVNRNADGYVVVCNEGKYYTLNSDKEKYGIDETGIDDACFFAKDRLIAIDDGKYGIYNYDFELLSEKHRYDKISGYANGVFAVYNGDKWGLMNYHGDMIIDISLLDVAIGSSGAAISNGYGMIKSEQGWQLIYVKRDDDDITNKDVTITQLDASIVNAKAPESAGCIAVQNKDGKWGFIDHNGKIIIDYQYEDAFSFSNGVAAVKVGSVWHYISIKNEVVIDLDFDDANPFHNGIAVAHYSDGETILQLSYY